MVSCGMLANYLKDIRNLVSRLSWHDVFIVTVLGMIGRIVLFGIEKQPNKLIKIISDQKTPFDFILWIQIKEVEEHFKKMDSKYGRYIYNKRLGKEHNFSTLKNKNQLRRFNRRGLLKTNIEAVLTAISFNLAKMSNILQQNYLNYSTG